MQIYGVFHVLYFIVNYYVFVPFISKAISKMTIYDGMLPTVKVRRMGNKEEGESADVRMNRKWRKAVRKQVHVGRKIKTLSNDKSTVDSLCGLRQWCIVPAVEEKCDGWLLKAAAAAVADAAGARGEVALVETRL